MQHITQKLIISLQMRLIKTLIFIFKQIIDKNFGGIKPLNIIIENEKSDFDITEYPKNY